MEKTVKHLIPLWKFLLLYSFLLLISFGCTDKKNHSPETISFDFKIDEFLNPSSEFKPFTRWWWPGNDVEINRLREEIRILAEKNFGGVEIQPFTTAINPDTKREEYIYSWDETSFYQNIKVVMNEALKRDILIDMNGGSGWPMGGPFVEPFESILTLAIGDTIISGKGEIHIPVPKVKINKNKIEKQRNRNYTELYNEVPSENYKLIAIFGGKVIEHEETQFILDQKTYKQIPFDDKNKNITWSAEEDASYAIIAIYIKPCGEKPLYIATKKESWVTDPFDNKSISNSLEYLFGQRTGLDKYYGNPFRGVFMDSKEYISDRHISGDFIEYFYRKRGYDITSWLITTAIEGYDNAYSFGRDTVPRYVLGEDDKRVRYDYNRTISELFNERSCKHTSDWLEKRGLSHRSQSYGLRCDVISAAGYTSIPEAEQLSGGGGDGFVKLISSGANLYNKPIVSQEAFVFPWRAYMTTPQKIKVFSNKAFAAGVNELVYHGTAYSYKTDDYGEEGWYPWASPYRNLNYSSNINETNSYWKYIGEVNHYISKVQYALRSGKPNVDILIYFPFIDFEASQIIRNPNELVFNGSYTNKEPYYFSNIGSFNQNPTTIQKWYMETWKLINKIESAGYTWSFVNDESLLVSIINRKGNFIIRENEYQAILIANLPYINLDVAEKIKKMTAKNGRFLFYGDTPNKQPGFLNYRKNEERIIAIFNAINNEKKDNVFYNDIDEWLKSIEQPISFQDECMFVKHLDRRMSDGSILKYLWNQTEDNQSITVQMSKNQYNYNYWIYPEKNEIVKINDEYTTITLNPFEAVLLYCSLNNKIDDHLLKERILPKDTVTSISQWRQKAKQEWEWRQEKSLLDLKEDEFLAFETNEILYEANFQISLEANKRYFIDLGEVFYTADVFINNTYAGHTIWIPHQLEITDFVKEGTNLVKVIVTPTKRNKYVKKALDGDIYYQSSFSRKESPMPVGLHGPVNIFQFVY